MLFLSRIFCFELALVPKKFSTLCFFRYFLDIFGQVFAICSAFASLLYFTFWNEPQLQQIYLGLFVIAFSTTLYILFKKTDSFFQVIFATGFISL